MFTPLHDESDYPVGGYAELAPYYDIVERYIGGKDWDSPAYIDRIRRLLRPALPSGSALGGA